MPIHPDDVLDVLRQTGRTIHLTELAQALHISPKQRATLEGALHSLEDAGLAKALPGDRFRASKAAGTYRDTQRRREPSHPPARTAREPVAQPTRGTFETRPRVAPAGAVGRGRIIVHPRGFAFVAVGDGGPDVFVPDDKLGPALHGDEVEVEMRPSQRGREGTVTGIVDRREARITGSIRMLRDIVLFEPDDPRLRRPMNVEGVLPIDPQQGEAYVAEIVRFPQGEGERASVVIGEKLGPQGETRTEIAKIIVREGVEESFAPSVVAEAKLVPKKVMEADFERREDIRALDLVTIDPQDARDHDDALFAERTADGYRLVIAIADVSHYVREGTAIDAEAQERGTSIYLPTHAIPMLPHEISSRIASLVPNEDRLCLAVEVFLGEDVRITSFRLFEAVMCSHARLTYENAARTLGLTEEGKRNKDAESRKPMLEIMLEVSRKLRKMRMKRGSLDFDLPEPKLTFESGEPVDVVRSRKDLGVREAYRLVEEMMLLANEVVAAELTRKNVPAIYRIHGRPDDRKLELFCRLATSLGHEIELDQARDPRSLARFIDKLGEAPETGVLRYLLLRAMQQASYDTNADVGHFGLGAPDYLHFTSPIRRYPDLAVHRIVRSLVRGEPLDAARLRTKHRKQATDSSRLERRAMSVERDVLDLYRALLMRTRIGEELPGIVTSVDSDGFSVTLDAPFVETRVDLHALPYDRMELDELGIRLTNRAGFGYALGDRVSVRISEVDLSARTVRAVPCLPPVRVEGARAARPARAERERAVRAGSERPVRANSERPTAKRVDGKRLEAKRADAKRAGTEPVEPKRIAAKRAAQTRVEPKLAVSSARAPAPKPKKHVVVDRRDAPRPPSRAARFAPAAPVDVDDTQRPVSFDERAWQERLRQKKARRAQSRTKDGARGPKT